MGYDFTKKTALQRKTREVGIISMVENLAGEELKTRPTSSDVTDERISSKHRAAVGWK